MSAISIMKAVTAAASGSSTATTVSCTIQRIIMRILSFCMTGRELQNEEDYD